MGLTTPLGLIAIGALVAIRWQAPPGASFILWGALTGVLGAVGIASLYQGLTVGRMGVVAPISATAPLIPVAIGLARGERPSALQGAGMCLALIGVVLDRPGARLDVAAADGLGRRLRAAGGGHLRRVAVRARPGGERRPLLGGVRDPLAASLTVAAVLLATRRPVRAPRSLLPAIAVIAVLDVGGTVLFARLDDEGADQRRLRARLARSGRSSPCWRGSCSTSGSSGCSSAGRCWRSPASRSSPAARAPISAAEGRS